MTVNPKLADDNVWKKIKSLPASETPFVVGNKTITYVHLNLLKTWNWKTNEETVRFFPYRNLHVTALARLKSGQLIFGTKDGFIFSQVPHFTLIDEDRNMITKILVVGPAHVIIKVQSEKKYLVHIPDGRTMDMFEKGQDVHFLKENYIVISKTPSIVIKNVLDYEHNYDSFVKPHYLIEVERNRFVFILNTVHGYGNKVITIWDVGQKTFFNDYTCSDSFSFTEETRKLFCMIDQNTFVVPILVGVNVSLRKCTYVDSKWKTETFMLSGSYRVTGMGVIDNFIVYATKAQNSGVHLFDFNGLRIASSNKFTNDGTSDPGKVTILGRSTIALEVIQQPIQIIKLGKCKRRLFIGEGDYSYTEALIKKHKDTHPLLASAITSTELSVLDYEGVRDRMKSLESDHGVKVLEGIKAQEIHKKFSIFDRFKRIHWNCPCGYSIRDKEHFQDVIVEFFNSCNQVQKCGDRIHITLIQEKLTDYWKTRQQDVPIVQASSQNGYILVRKRYFSELRYPGYCHKKTNGEKYGFQEEKREFVFEKVSFNEDYIIKKPHAIQTSGKIHYLECDTDYDSSDYCDYDSD